MFIPIESQTISILPLAMGIIPSRPSDLHNSFRISLLSYLEQKKTEFLKQNDDNYF